MRKKTNEELIEEAAERARYDIYENNTVHAVDPEFDDQPDMFESIGDLAKEVLRKVGQK